MDSDDDYEYNMDKQIPAEQDYAVGKDENKRERANSPSSSENGDDYNDPLVLSPIHTMDIPSVRRPPVSVMVPANRVSTHDLPLAETLSVVERELFHIYKRLILRTRVHSVCILLFRPIHRTGVHIICVRLFIQRCYEVPLSLLLGEIGDKVKAFV